MSSLSWSVVRKIFPLFCTFWEIKMSRRMAICSWLCYRTLQKISCLRCSVFTKIYHHFTSVHIYSSSIGYTTHDLNQKAEMQLIMMMTRLRILIFQILIRSEQKYCMCFSYFYIGTAPNPSTRLKKTDHTTNFEWLSRIVIVMNNETQLLSNELWIIMLKKT